jgi:hypothetical protein
MAKYSSEIATAKRSLLLTILPVLLTFTVVATVAVTQIKSIENTHAAALSELKKVQKNSVPHCMPKPECANDNPPCKLSADVDWCKDISASEKKFPKMVTPDSPTY